ncbi:MAG TPA: hypothetical protein PL009_00500 [Flavipsychrobacter sp.]|nr:hypothetical protein [Flavipsychrobacter sp.]
MNATPKNIAEFEASKIFEKLEFRQAPSNYSGKIPWKIQLQVAATNGIHFIPSIGKLDEYPIPEIPIENSYNQDLLLDIGCGWGRWLVASGKKKLYTNWT